MNTKVNITEMIIEDLELVRIALRHCLEHDCWGNAKDVLAVAERLRVTDRALSNFYDEANIENYPKLEDVEDEKINHTTIEE